MKHQLLTHRQTQICATLLVADCLVFTMVNPAEASAHWLMVGYILLGITLFSFAGLIAVAVKGYGEQAHRRTRRLLRYGTAVAVALIGLQSIGQLTVKDMLAMLPFVVIIYLYFGYGKKPVPDTT